LNLEPRGDDEVEVDPDRVLVEGTHLIHSLCLLNLLSCS